MGGLEARVVGAEQLSRLSGTLRASGPEFRRAFTRTLRVTAREGVKAVKLAAHENMPKAGGLNEWLQDAKFGIRITTEGKNAGLRIVAQKQGHDIRAFDQGDFRHPVFGNRQNWVPESVTPGFFSETLEHEKGRITRNLINDMNHYTAQLRHI